MIHTTIGVYPNGDYKVNGVESKNLGSHLEHNREYRWGRALFLDGHLIYGGSVNEEVLRNFKEKQAQSLKADTDTAPYN